VLFRSRLTLIKSDSEYFVLINKTGSQPLARDRLSRDSYLFEDLPDLYVFHTYDSNASLIDDRLKTVKMQRKVGIEKL
jgi:hypothetical protein